MIKRLNNFGDTIVEVFIAIAVLSVILAGAYAIANRSLSDIRQAQEHSIALKYAEKQLERLKKLSDGNGDDGTGIVGHNIYQFTSGYCIDYAGGIFVIQPDTAMPQCSPNNGVNYKNSITYTHIGNQYTFIVAITWPSIHGNGNDTVSITYNIDKSS